MLTGLLDRKLTSIGMMQITNSEWPIRAFLLAEVQRFAERACTCLGVRRIALVGSLTTDKENPKDADVLVTVDDDADLVPLATLGRRLKGHAQSRNKGADIFLADPSGRYIGRICSIGANATLGSVRRATPAIVGGVSFCMTTSMMSRSTSL